MSKEWSSFRITLLLYILVLILPLSFYFVYSSFKTIQNDTKIVYKSGWTGGAIEYLALNPKSQNSQRMITDIDTTLQDISVWVIQNDTSNLYVGAESLSQDLTQVTTCWDNYKQILSQQDTTALRGQALQCWGKANSLAIIVEKMVYLKQNKMINLFYFSLTLAMILILLVIYMVRIYIHRQMKKHALYDYETKLFNKKYFLAELHSTCARSKRNNNPLSLLFVSLNDFTKDTYDKKTRKDLLLELGEFFLSITRESDILCRYDENHFAILLPLTSEENALVLEGHLKEAMEKHDFKVTPEVKFSFATTLFDADETEESFIIRTKELLK